MKILTVQEAFKRKFERQKKIKELEYHASGQCAHIGKLSPGCYSCFVPDNFSANINIGAKCDLKCPYCPTNKNEKNEGKSFSKKLKLKILQDSCLPNFHLRKISFTGGGEPLMYMDRIYDFMKFFHNIEKHSKEKPWYFLYSNGLLANESTLNELKGMGFNEIRFHLGATNFSEKVYKNIKRATKYLKVVSVETPAWPLHRKKLFEMLPVIEDIGVKHLNIGEVEIHPFNYKIISRLLPKAEIYHCYQMHLFDDGLVYDIIEEVLRKKYSYSVLDCNSFVKHIQRSPGKMVCYEPIKGLCAKY